MVMYYYQRFNCQICGKRTRTKKSPVKGDFNGRHCHVCHRLICYKCSVGGFCKICFESFPKDIRATYEKKAKKLKNFKKSYIGAILFCCFLAFLAAIFAFSASKISAIIYFAAMILAGLLVFPGSVILIYVLHTESKFTDSEAKLFLRKYPKLKLQ